MNRFGNADSRTLLGTFLVGGGLVWLGLRYFGGSVDLLWPFFVIVPGVVVLAFGVFGEWRSRGAAIGGAIVTTVGFILLVQSSFDYFQSWAYAWALLPLAGGVGSLLYGQQSGDRSAVDMGRSGILWSAAAFVLFAAAFELLIFGTRIANADIVFPVILIGVGAFLLLWRRGEPAAGDGSPHETPNP